MIVTRNLTKRFGKVVAVDHLNLRVRRGEIYALLGPNGAGKTTTIRMILGLLKPDEGEIYVNGIDAVRNPQAVKRITGYMSQHFTLYSDLTVMENLEFFGQLYEVPKSVLKERIRELLDLLELWEHRHKLAGALSGGLKQRLSLACALIHDPALLVLDEPTAGVDPPLRRKFWRYFRELQRQGKTILVTTHYMDEAELADRIGLMRRGRLIAEGTPREIKRMVHGGDVMRIVAKADGIECVLLEFYGVKKILEKRRLSGRWEYIVVVDDFAQAVTEIAPRLRDVALLIEPVNITLEDAFIKLTGGESSA